MRSYQPPPRTSPLYEGASGKVPCSQPGKKTVSHSRPLALWIVRRLIAPTSTAGSPIRRSPAPPPTTPSGAKYFSYTCTTSGTFQTYTLTATGATGRVVGSVYTLTTDGTKATTQFKGSAVSKACWLANGSEC